MAFEILTDKLTAAIQKLRGQKTVSEQDLKETCGKCGWLSWKPM